jgi:hypothetical protein
MPTKGSSPSSGAQRAGGAVVDGSFLTGRVAFCVRGDEVVIRRSEWGASEPEIRARRAAVANVRTEAAPRLLNRSVAASLWIDWSDGSPPLRLVKRGEAQALAKLADDAAALLGLRAPPPEPASGTRVASEWRKRDLAAAAAGDAAWEIPSRPVSWGSPASAGGTLTAMPRELRFVPRERCEPALSWPRSDLFAVEVRRPRADTWAISVRRRDGGRTQLLAGYDESDLRELAREVNEAMGVPLAAERVRVALAAAAAAGAKSRRAAGVFPLAADALGGSPIISYAPVPSDRALYELREDSLRIVLPRVGWRGVPTASGFIPGALLLAAGLAGAAAIAYLVLRPTPFLVFVVLAIFVGGFQALRAVFACLALATIYVDADAVSLRLESRLLPSGPVSRRWECDRILDVRAANAASSDVLLELASGDTVTLVPTPHADDAREYARRLREVLGLPP